MNERTHGIRYAATEDGEELPVIDVTHPAFRLEIEQAALGAELERAVATVQAHSAMPPDQQHGHMEHLLRGSLLAPRIAAAQGTFLSGMSTYMLKLGPENLGTRASAVDRAIAASMPCLSCRLRLQDMARMTAEELAPLLGARPGDPLLLLNIAGGPGMDSLNALIVLRQAHPGLLDGRAIHIRILDIDDAGPRFGSRALAALRAPDGPLEGLAIELQHTRFDWSKASELQDSLDAGGDPPAIVAASSEGGLFEYAPDDQIKGLLREYRRCTDGDAFFIGSVSRGDGAAGILNEAGRAAIHLWRLEEFSALVREEGWRVSGVGESPLSWEVALRK
jgi:hypothetical protein